MGAVYKAIDFMIEREVAIKVLRPEFARRPEIVARFRSEATALAKLNHPSIATLYSFFRQGDDFFMVMEFVRGETLASVIARSGAIACDVAIPQFCEILEAIGFAHKNGIVHRDIKPSNVMLTEAGSVKVMDFGIARVVGTERTTRQGSVIGTFEYMSPEHIQGYETDQRSDIYSLGILLYELLTGRLPFTGNNEYELMKAQIEKEPPSPRVFVPNVPLAVGEVRGRLHILRLNGSEFGVVPTFLPETLSYFPNKTRESVKISSCCGIFLPWKSLWRCSRSVAKAEATRPLLPPLFGTSWWSDFRQSPKN